MSRVPRKSGRPDCPVTTWDPVQHHSTGTSLATSSCIFSCYIALFFLAAGTRCSEGPSLFSLLRVTAHNQHNPSLCLTLLGESFSNSPSGQLKVTSGLCPSSPFLHAVLHLDEDMSPHMLQDRSLCIVCILCCCMISLALGQSYDYGFDVARAYNTKRQLGESIVVTSGMPVGSGPVPVRPDLRDLQKDADRWSLYILALDMMQYTDQSYPTSWFSISGTLHCASFLSGPLESPQSLSLA